MAKKAKREKVIVDLGYFEAISQKAELLDSMMSDDEVRIAQGDFKAYKSIHRDQERLEDRGFDATEIYEEPAEK